MGKSIEYFFQRKYINGAKPYENVLNITNYQRNTKQKPQGDITSYSWGWILLKKKKRKCRWGGGNRRSLHAVVGNVNWSAIWKTVWTFFKKLKIELPCESLVPPIGKYIKNIKSKILKRYLHTHAQGSIIHKSQVIEAAYCLLMDGWRKKA